MQSEAIKLLKECPDFALVCLIRLCVTLALQTIQVCVAYYIYDVTGDPYALAWLGLAGLLPAICLVLFTGYAADRFPRRRILLISDLSLTTAAFALLMLILYGGGVIWPIYIIVVLISTSRAFNNPAAQSIVPAVVPAERLSTGVALSTSTFQAGQIVGPVMGGLAYAIDPRLAFGLAITLFVIASIAAAMIKYSAAAVSRKDPITVESLVAGIKYTWQNKAILGGLSLDLVCAMFGSVTMLLPIFARDILDVGSAGAGILRAAPAIGGLMMAAWLSNNHYVKRGSGTKLFASVAIYGTFIALFGLSTNIYLSVLLLAFSGAADMVSVVIRHTLVQAETPNELRGRVSAVNAMMISSSTELGNIRTGVFAGLFGAGPAAVIGGLAAVACAFLWPRMFPVLRDRDHLVEEQPSMPVPGSEKVKQAGS